MTTVYDVPAKELIDEIANKLRDNPVIKLPEQNTFSKTSVARENPPDNRDWWCIRCASILRKIYLHGPIGVEALRAEYGGKKDRGSKPYKARGGSGSIIRRALQQLEEAGYVSKVRGKGRKITSKGQSFLDNTAYELLQKIKDKYPGLEKY
ncbi:MAG: 30S ribosomal protein S19e [Thermoplasmata archaeon]|nr:MAG: 30S ribosomal protein S19e [Thermoplasmata archaeon]